MGEGFAATGEADAAAGRGAAVLLGGRIGFGRGFAGAGDQLALATHRSGLAGAVRGDVLRLGPAAFAIGQGGQQHADQVANALGVARVGQGVDFPVGVGADGLRGIGHFQQFAHGRIGHARVVDQQGNGHAQNAGGGDELFPALDRFRDLALAFRARHRADHAGEAEAGLLDLVGDLAQQAGKALLQRGGKVFNGAGGERVEVVFQRGQQGIAKGGFAVAAQHVQGRADCRPGGADAGEGHDAEDVDAKADPGNDVILIAIDQGNQVCDGIDGGKDAANPWQDRANGVDGVPADGVVGHAQQPLVELLHAEVDVALVQGVGWDQRHFAVS
ncbi:hypothetical protein D3C76_858470 [compost metagenome]